MRSAPRSNSESFGSGDVRGVIAPESSNNAKEGGHLVPTIAFGVPAGASMAMLLGAFLMHGLQPGPEMLTKHLDLTYTIVWSLTLAHVIGALICLPAAAGLRRFRASARKFCCRSSVVLVFVAAFQGSHDWGDLYSLFLRGHRLVHEAARLAASAYGARPGGRRAFSSVTSSFRPSSTAGLDVAARRSGVLALVAWALYRPLSQLVIDVIAQLRTSAVGNFASAGGGVHACDHCPDRCRDSRR